MLDGYDNLTLGPDDVLNPNFPEEDTVRWEFSTPFSEYLEE